MISNYNCPKCGTHIDYDEYDWAILTISHYRCKHCGTDLKVESASYWDEDEGSSPTVTLSIAEEPCLHVPLRLVAHYPDRNEWRCADCGSEIRSKPDWRPKWM